MAITTHRKVTLFGTDITSTVTSLAVNKTSNRCYHTLDIGINKALFSSCTKNCTEDCTEYSNIIKTATRNKNMWLDVEIGTDTYKFYITDLEANHKEQYKIIAQTKGIFLDFPFSSKENITIAGTANGIITQLCLEVGLTVNITTADFGFGSGSFTMFGTRAEVIKRLCEVTGANYYQKDEDIYIVPSFRIPQNATPILVLDTKNKEITAITNRDNADGSKLVKSVTFNSKLKEVLSIPRIIVREDGCVKSLMFNPLLTDVESQLIHNFRPQSAPIIGTPGYIGTEIRELTETETQELSNTRVIFTRGAIKSLNSITINGVPTTEYTFEYGHNGVLFDSEVTGVIEVRYITNIAQNIAYLGTKGMVQFFNEYIEYELGDCGKRFEGNNSADGTCEIIVDSGYNRSTPITIRHTHGAMVSVVAVETLGATPDNVINQYGIDFLKKGDTGTDFADNATLVTSVVTPRRADATVQMQGDKFGINIPPNRTHTEAKVDGQAVTLTAHPTITDFYYVGGSTGQQEGMTCEYLYEQDFDTLTLPIAGANTKIREYKVYSCGKETIIPYSANGEGAESCNYPTNVVIDMVAETGKDLSNLVGVVLPSDFGDVTIDNWGKLTVELAGVGTFAIDSTSIIPNSTLKVIGA